jgi:hypothetical protein
LISKGIVEAENLCPNGEMSRFLVRPRGCHNLASHLLGAVLHRLPDDFEARFGYRPWLVESFVDTARFDGTCYRAANWIEIGDPLGRGRQDRMHRREAGTKAIYMYALEAHWRERLGVRAPSPPASLTPGAGLELDSFAQQQSGGAALGDERSTTRLVARLAEQPGRHFGGAAQGDRAAVKGYYRLIDPPDSSAVTMANILATHHQRSANEARVLSVADTTTLDYTGLAQCTGLGRTASNQTGAHSWGIQMHSTLAVNDQGIPLGINLVLAWRIMVMTLLGREAPQLPAELMFSEIENEVLADWVRRHRYPLKPPDTLGHATLSVAIIMGGYLNRNSDPPPGHQLMWHGQHYLQALCIGYELRAS